MSIWSPLSLNVSYTTFIAPAQRSLISADMKTSLNSKRSSLICVFVAALLAGCSAQQIHNLDTELNWRKNGFDSPEEYRLSKEFPGLNSDVLAGLKASGIKTKQQLNEITQEMARVNYSSSPTYEAVFDYIQDKKEADQQNTTPTQLLNNRTKLMSKLFNKKWAKNDTDCRNMGIGFSRDFPMGKAYYIFGNPSKVSAPSQHNFSSNGIDTIILKYSVYPNNLVINAGIPSNTAINEGIVTIKMLSSDNITIKETGRNADASMLLKGRLVYKTIDEEGAYKLCK